MKVNVFKNGGIGAGSSFSGGTVTQPIVLPDDPTQPLEASTKQYVDNSIVTHANNSSSHLTSSEKALLNGITVSATEINHLSGVTGNIQTQLNGKLNLSGGILTGYLTLAGDPTQALHIATKQYVDTTISTATSNIIDATVVAAPSIIPSDFNVYSGANKSWTVSSTAYLNGSSVASFEVDWAMEVA